MEAEKNTQKLRLRDRLLRFRKRPLLFGMIILLIICVIFMVIFLYMYTRRIISKTAESRSSVMDAMLDLAVENSDHLFEISVGQPIEAASNTYSIAAVSFASTQFHISSSSLARVKSDLNTMAVTSPLISAAFLYVPNADLIIASDYTSDTSYYSRYYAIIESYESGYFSKSTINISDDNISMFRYGTDYILACDLFVLNDTRQSTIFLQLNRDEIYEHVQKSINKNDLIHIYIYDDFGNQITSSDPDDLNLSFDRSQIPDGTTSFTTADNLRINIRQSDKTFLCFYLTVDEAYLNTSFSDIFKIILPFALLLVFFICAISVLSMLYFYRPFQNAMHVLQTQVPLPEGTGSRNEFEYLSQTLTSIIDQQDQLKNMVLDITDDIQTQLLNNLLSGNVISYDQLTYILQNINSSLEINSVYTVGTLVFSSEQDIDRGTYKHVAGVINNLAHKIIDGYDFNCYIINTAHHTLAVIIQFNDIDISIERGKDAARRFKDAVDKSSMLKAFDYDFEFGHLYHSILDLAFSYKEALESVSKDTYLQDSLTDRRIRQILDSCQIGGDQMINLIDDSIDEIISSVPPKDAKSVAETFLQTLIDQAIRTFSVNLSGLPDVYDKFSKDISLAEDVPAITEELKKATELYTSNLSGLLMKQQNPYIITAKEYVSEHYMDPELNIDQIAALEGISSSYLGKLFKESLGMTLFEYITKFRVDASVNDLLNSDMTINAITEKYGFAAPRNYIYAFKKYYSETPGEYRKTVKLNNS